MVDVVLVAVLEDGGLVELKTVGALILMSVLTHLARLLYDAGSSCEVCLMVFFHFASFVFIVDEVFIGDFPVFGDLLFCYENIVPVPSMRSAFCLVFPMPVQSLLNSFARERVQVGPSGAGD